MKYLSIFFLLATIGFGFTALNAQSACCTEKCQEENCLDVCTCDKDCEESKSCGECCTS